MQPRKLQPYIIRARKRPLRVAYLLDAHQTKAADVDALLWTCLRSWGGRLSPILPFTEAKTDINGFGEKDFTNLRMCAERLRPDRIVLFSMTGDASSDFEAQLAALRAAVALHGVRETLWRRPMPSVFEALHHTETCSLPAGGV
ncbi:MAG TPA: hypothetical protein VN853_20880 [Polyangia bacterium]|nr:hypothetical protein [Polyangia bacterium]